MMRPDRPEWTAAKAVGDAAELAVARHFARMGFDAYQTIGRIGFDLLVQSRVEVKRDLQAKNTGNVAIEVEYAGNPSGIIDTDAQYWAIAINGDAFIMRTKDLRELALSGSYREVAAGEGARVRLIPIEDLREDGRIKWIQLPELDK